LLNAQKKKEKEQQVLEKAERRKRKNPLPKKQSTSLLNLSPHEVGSIAALAACPMEEQRKTP